MTWTDVTNAVTYQRVKEIAIALAVVWVVHLYVVEHDARVKTDADAKLRAAQTQQLTQQQADRTEAARQADATAAKRTAAIHTSSDAAQVIRQHLRPAPTPAQTDAAVQVQPPSPALPDTPSNLILSPDAAKQIATQQIECDATGTKLNLCLKNYEDEQTKTQLAQRTADEYKQALQGGTKVHRTVEALKAGGCAAGGAAAGAAGGGAKGAAIGAGVSFALCKLLWR